MKETIQPNLAFAELASDETIARTVAALGPSGITAEVVDNGAVGRARVLELLPLGAEVFHRPLRDARRDRTCCRDQRVGPLRCDPPEAR